MRRHASIFLAILALSCQWGLDRSVDREINTSELVGDWVINDFGLQSLRDTDHERHLNPKDHQVKFRADGSCSFTGILEPIVTGDRPGDPRFLSTEFCSWSIKKSPKEPEVILILKEDGSERMNYFIAEEDDALILWRYTTDPDAWKYLELEKRR